MHDVVAHGQASTNGHAAAASSQNEKSKQDALQPALSVVVPTRNEAPNIERLVEELEQVLPGIAVEIIFVDDSTDDTPQTIQTVRRRRRRREIVLIHRPPDERGDGLGGAVLRGFRAARAPWVCVMDADLQHPPHVIESLVREAMSGDVDLVVASRYCGEGGGTSDFGLVRSLVSKASNLAARMMFPGKLRGVTDPMSGFFLLRLDAVPLDALRPRGFKILLEVLARSEGLDVAEVPFVFGVRHAGESKASLSEGISYLTQLVRLRVGDEIFRFGAVGLSGLGVNAAAFAAAVALGAHYLLAAVVATQVSTASNFVLLESWAFRRRAYERPLGIRLVSFFAMNNATLALRSPALVLLVAVLGVQSTLANALTLIALMLGRFGFSSSWIWGGCALRPGESASYCYRIHDVVTVESPVRLRELERFRVERLAERPTIRVRLGRLSAEQSRFVDALAYMIRHTRYDEGLGRFGFGIEIAIGRWTEILASPLLAYSPHVLYTNVVEPVLRWTFVKRGYTLAHAACIAFDGDAYLVTARTDTGKTTTILKTLDSFDGSFISDDLTLLTPDGRVLTYPKPLTISRHTLHAVRMPLLSRRERLALFFQSRIHSRSGRQFGLLLARLRIPAGTVNAIVQLLIPPPKYDVTRLIPDVHVETEARLAGMIVIERGGTGDFELSHDEAVETLVANSDDAYGFPPYPVIAEFLHSGNGRDLRADERAIIASALQDVPAVLLRSETMDWYERLPQLVQRGTPSRRHGSEAPVPTIEAVIPLAYE